MEEKLYTKDEILYMLEEIENRCNNQVEYIYDEYDEVKYKVIPKDTLDCVLSELKINIK